MQQTLAEQKAWLKKNVPWATSMLAALERDGFVVQHIVTRHRTTWFLRVAPPRGLREGFGLASEVLIVAVTGQVMPRDLARAADEVLYAGLRLDGNLVIVCDDHPETLVYRLAQIQGHGQRVAWCRARISSSPPSALQAVWPSLADRLRTALPTFDVFEERDPVRGNQLLGRDDEVAALRTRVVRGESVGLFGVRKMGKTSVMRAVTDWFDPASGLRSQDGLELKASQGVVVAIDAGSVIENNVDALADELLNVLRRRMTSVGDPIDLAPCAGLRGWKCAIEAILDRGTRVCVAIDEYDLLFEGIEGGQPLAGLGRFFRLMRAFSQTRQGQLSMVLVGRDPTYMMEPVLEGATSPLLGWCTPVWVKPLPFLRARDLLVRLGLRAGLEVGSQSVKVAYEWTGGHPLLLRQFGSALREAIREQTDAWGAKTDAFSATAVQRFVRREAVQGVGAELVSLFQKRYPVALDALIDLASDEAPERVRARYANRPEVFRALTNFGLLGDDGSPLWGFLKQYLMRVLAPSAPRMAG